MSKGDKDRTADREAFRNSWEKIFGKSRAHLYEDVVLPDGSIGRKAKPLTATSALDEVEPPKDKE
jgi:hypothetical protein